MQGRKRTDCEASSRFIRQCGVALFIWIQDLLKRWLIVRMPTPCVKMMTIMIKVPTTISRTGLGSKFVHRVIQIPSCADASASGHEDRPALSVVDFACHDQSRLAACRRSLSYQETLRWDRREGMRCEHLAILFERMNRMIAFAREHSGHLMQGPEVGRIPAATVNLLKLPLTTPDLVL